MIKKYSKEIIINLIKKENSLLPIKSKAEFCRRINIPGQTIHNYFGNFNNLLKITNIKINTNRYIKGFSKEELIKELQDRNKKGEIIKLKDLNKMSCSNECIRNKFGTIENFQKEANIKLIRIMSKSFSKEELINIIKDKISKGEVVYKKDIQLKLKIARDTLIRKFSTIENLEKHINHKFPKCPISNETKNKLKGNINKIKWTKEKILTDVKEGIKNRKIKYKKDIKLNLGLARDTIILRFGSIKNFEKELGYKFPNAPSIVSDEVKKRNRERYEKQKRIKRELYIKQLKDITQKKLIVKKDLDNILGCNSETIRNLFGSTDKLAEYANIQFAKCPDNRIFNYGGRPGKNENLIIDIIEKIENIKYQRNIYIKGNNGHYYVDGINHKRKIILEVDEKYHSNLQQEIKDKLRENDILTVLPEYSFIRIKEQDFLKNINQTNILQFL